LVDKQAAGRNEADQITYFKELLAKASGDFTVSDPFHQTIGGKDYLGIAYTIAEADYQIYFHKTGGNLVEVALHFPQAEKEQASQFLNTMKAMN
jgi:hypothetical protein